MSSTTEGTFNNARLVIGLDGMIYGTVEKILFGTNPETLNIEILRTKKDAEKLVRDQKGNFYFKSGYELWKATFK